MIRIGCAGVILKDNKILLGLRGKEGPAYKKWVLPGGGVNDFEHLEETLKREILEECGIEIEIGKQIGAYQIIIPESNLHKIVIYYWANYKDGNLRPDDDTIEARFFTREEVSDLVKKGEVTPNIENVLRDIGWA